MMHLKNQPYTVGPNRNILAIDHNTQALVVHLSIRQPWQPITYTSLQLYHISNLVYTIATDYNSLAGNLP